MARILAFALQTPGHLFPFVPLLLELQNRGHTVSAAICARNTVVPTLASIPVLPVYWGAHDARGDESQVSLNARRFLAYGGGMAHALRDLIARERPDVLIIDPILWGGMIAAEASGVPWVNLAHNPLTFRGMGEDVRGPGLRPPQSPGSRFYHWWVAQVMAAKAADQLAAVNALRAAHGLNPQQRLDEMFLKADLVLATTSEPFEYPRDDWPDHLRFVGPLTWEPPSLLNWDVPPSEGRPLILVAGSSIQENTGAERWIHVVLDALATEPYQLIATVPTGTLPAARKNARVVRGMPHGAIVKHAACVVCHGGPGITQKALAHGVPVIAVPFAFDRFEVARRVEVARAGVMLPLSHLTPKSIRKAVRDAFSARAGASRVAASFSRAGGASAAASHVESFCLT